MGKQTGIKFLILIVFAASLNVFALSGLALRIEFSEICTLFSIPLLLIYMLRSNRYRAILNPIVLVFVSLVCFSILIAIMSNWHNMLQLVNFVTLFGVILWVNILSDINWLNKNYFHIGLVLTFFSIVFMYLFLSGNLLSGWNSNSSIFIISILFFGIVSIYISYHKQAKPVLIFIVLISFIILMELSNRSALLAVLLFVVIAIYKKAYTNRSVFRAIYVTIILFNVALPYCQDAIVHSSFFKDIMETSQSVVEKRGGLNGREYIWELAVSKISIGGFFGNLGNRTIYFHNFSLDVLFQFGWLGWIAFMAMVIALLEKIFKENSVYNLFLVGFVCLLFMNTFENALVCNNHFTIFSYLLLAVPWSLQRSDGIVDDVIELKYIKNSFNK